MDSVKVFYEIEKILDEHTRNIAMVNIICLLEEFSQHEYKRGLQDHVNGDHNA